MDFKLNNKNSQNFDNEINSTNSQISTNSTHEQEQISANSAQEQSQISENSQILANHESHENSSFIENIENLDFDDIQTMRPIAQAKFNEIVQYLKENGKFNQIDTVLIEIFARAYETYLEHYHITIKQGAVLKSDKGNEYLSPANMVMQQSFKTMQSLTKELGIGNFSRAKLDMQIQERDDFISKLTQSIEDDESEFEI